jgi:ketosteroid isomerase-like protein
VSRKNIDVVRRIWEAWELRDNDAALALYDPNVEATSLPGAVGLKGDKSSTYRGMDGLRRWMRDFTEVFDDFVVRPEQFLEAGDGVVVRVRMSGRGKRSGAPSEIVFWNAYKLQQGRVVRLESHREKAEALRAAGSPA